MSNKNILILTGAGFGKDADLPVEKEIMKLGLKACENKKPEVIEGLKNLWQSIDPKHPIEHYSFEDLLTKIILEEQLNKNPQRGHNIQNIKLAVLEIFLQSLKAPLSKKSPKHYVDFLDLYKDYAYFATLNYDYLIEKLLISNKIPWTYGYNFNEINIDPNSRKFYIQGESADFHSIFCYLKLHGSFNWHFCWRCKNTRLSKFVISGEIFSKTNRSLQACTCIFKSGQPIMQPLIVPPSAIKYYNLPIFLQLWFEFKKIIEKVEKLIIIGCSVRDDDTMLIYILYNLYQKNPNLRKIVLIDPEKTVQEKTQDYTKMKVNRYKYLKEFLLYHR
ncbi:MAG: SIR2 family protein [Nitrosopumilus sp.]